MNKIIKEIIKNFREAERLSTLLSETGFSDGRKAGVNLHLLFKDIEDQQIFRKLMPAVLKSCIASPDPDMSLNNLERFVVFYEDKERLYTYLTDRSELIPVLLFLFGSSQYLSNFLFSAPQEYLVWLSIPNLLRQAINKESQLDYLRKQISTVRTSINDIKSLLRRFRKKEYIRIALRDMLGYAILSEVTQEISAVADICLQIAYEFCNNDLIKRYGMPMYTDVDGNTHNCAFTILGMGKLGGEELNYSSDIDIMFLYTSDRGETSTGQLNNHQFYVKLSEMVSRIIGDVTEEGFVFRVDTRLRPEGDKGDLASSLRSYEVYYESWGLTWERAALSKTRPSAGDENLGKAFLSMIQPFVYRKYLDFNSIDEIRDMKVKIDKHIAVKGKDLNDVKLGYGGIREIEFFVQALQLLYGGKEPWIREKNTLRALHRLAQKGFISYDEEGILSNAYHLLRRIEHGVQIVGERQVHVMPNDAKELYILARRLGYKDKGRSRADEFLMKDYLSCTKAVRKIYDGLFVKKTAEEGPMDEEGACEIVIGDVVPEEEAIHLLSKYNFKDARKAYRNIILLRDGPAFSHQTPRSRQIFSRIFPKFFNLMTSFSDPDLALNNLEALISSAGARETLYSFFEENPQAIEAVIRLFSSSEYLSKIVMRHTELVDLFLDPEEMLKKRTKKALQDELFTAIRNAQSYTEKLDTLRKFKYTEELRIGYTDILGYAVTAEVSKNMSALADCSVYAAVIIAEEELGRTYGRPMSKPMNKPEKASTARFCVVGMGKLGGEEITYGSDLDLIFIYSGEGETKGKHSISNAEYFSFLSSKIMSALTSITREGTVFKVDVRLRPSGTKGPLCQSIEGVISYIRDHADTWEFQYLTRARIIAGDETLGQEFITGCQNLTYRRHNKEFLRKNIRDMRQRMEREVSKEDDEHYDIKVGPGGIVDIEFIVQYLKLLHGSQYPAIRVTNTLTSLELLYKEGVLSKDNYFKLKKAYTFLRTLESRLRIVHNMPSHLLPKNPDTLASLAMRMDYKDTKRLSAARRLIKAYEAYRKDVRGIMNEVFAG
ncbi:MAG: bifunctional [glutamate--ammonia ligase]-adenylyl-L-tyrosine phosphorylase/[glutamate--ammonia-ligase] adenylyltransferase [Nitrospirae bacterium]|nr:bifunctional [glutamate--ammonia ligase]-adenylyl-L-tyrosine phosphorylase/[glutamate--ammonia-ligase] adenylyltransferase [Nitrospirota bacterium]